MIQDTGYRIHNLMRLWFIGHSAGYKIQDTRYRIQDTRYRIHDTGYRIQDTGYRIQDTGYRIQEHHLPLRPAAERPGLKITEIYALF